MPASISTILPAPEALKHDVECIRTGEYYGEEAFSISVSPNGLPGIVFQHHNGYSPVEHITTPTGYRAQIPTLFLYGQVAVPGVMRHKPGPYTLTQVLLKPHALHTLFGLNAATLTNSLVALEELSAAAPGDQLLNASSQQERITLITEFLLARLKASPPRDHLVEESLRLIHRNTGSVQVKWLIKHLNISERHFERRFSQVVGLSPQRYIRIKRFNHAVTLIKSGRFARFTDVAHTLNYFDESHFIRDIKALSGTTPKDLAHKLDGFHPDQRVVAYL